MAKKLSPDSLARHDLADRVVFGCCAAAFVVAAILYLAFADRKLVYDEIGLHNPIYQYLQYGRMTYPAHGHFDDMTVHPPVHYMIVAWMMRLGLSLYHAAAILPCTLFILLCVLLFRSTYSLSLRISILAGVFLGALVWNQTYTIRPDVSMVMTWITGLIAMECSRQAQWERKRLFLGSFLLTLSSAIHYPAFLAGVSLLFYIAWIWRTVPVARAIRSTAIVSIAAAMVALPYLFLFLLPFRKEIVTMVSSADTRVYWLTALQAHRASYQVWRQAEAVHAASQPVVQVALSLLWATLIPAAFIGPPLLALSRGTRGLALTCVPLILFIALGASHKQLGYTGYFSPEIVIYLVGLFACAGSLVGFAARRLPPGLARRGSWVLALVFCAAVLHDRPANFPGTLKLRRDIDDLDLGRAATRNIVNPGALVGTVGAGVWYTSGGDHAYQMNRDILVVTSVADIDLKTYFGHFDAVVAGSDQSWVTLNKERVTVTSEYVKGTLHLKGFYFGDSRQPELSVMVLSARGSGLVSGYATQGPRVFQFREDPAGKFVYYSAVCPQTDSAAMSRLPFSATYYLPGPGDDEYLGVHPDTPAIRTLLVSQEQFHAEIEPASSACTVRDKVYGALTEVSRSELLAGLRNDARIAFYRSLPAALAMSGRVRPETMETIRVADLAGIRAGATENRLAIRDGTARFDLLPMMWHDAAYLPLKLDSVGPQYLFIEGDVRNAKVGISLRQSSNHAMAGSEVIWGPRDGVTSISIPLTVRGADELAFRSVETGGGEMHLKRVAVLRPRSAGGDGNNGGAKRQLAPVRDLAGLPR